MKTGRIIGKGMTSVVYELDSNRVLKLFSKMFNQDKIKKEAENTKIIHEAGIPSPSVYQIKEVRGRRGIEFEQIRGRSILRHTEMKPLSLKHYAQQMAGLHYIIHKHSTDMLPSQKEKLATAISKSRKILGGRENKILEYLNSLPDGNSICHGDLHFENIIVSDKGLIAIDWANANTGNPLGDVARTCLNICSPTLPFGISGFLFMPYMYSKLMTNQDYRNEYVRLSQVNPEDIDAWILPVAAARLSENIQGEKGWLICIIDKYLRRYK